MTPPPTSLSAHQGPSYVLADPANTPVTTAAAARVIPTAVFNAMPRYSGGRTSAPPSGSRGRFLLAKLAAKPAVSDPSPLAPQLNVAEVPQQTAFETFWLYSPGRSYVIAQDPEVGQPDNSRQQMPWWPSAASGALGHRGHL